MLSRVIAKNIGDVILRHSIDKISIKNLYLMEATELMNENVDKK